MGTLCARFDPISCGVAQRSSRRICEVASKEGRTLRAWPLQLRTNSRWSSGLRLLRTSCILTTDSSHLSLPSLRDFTFSTCLGTLWSPTPCLALLARAVRQIGSLFGSSTRHATNLEKVCGPTNSSQGFCVACPRCRTSISAATASAAWAHRKHGLGRHARRTHCLCGSLTCRATDSLPFRGSCCRHLRISPSYVFVKTEWTPPAWTVSFAWQV
mmetsp:Transcript_17049/g.46205  ORF Transcript_17049/g.46205 Transcript_17049/m.46205 type:complete len:214 (-) Transcript_17049:960-1601(-)